MQFLEFLYAAAGRIHPVLCLRATDVLAAKAMGTLPDCPGPVPNLQLFLIHQWTDICEIQ